MFVLLGAWIAVLCLPVCIPQEWKAFIAFRSARYKLSYLYRYTFSMAPKNAIDFFFLCPIHLWPSSCFLQDCITRHSFRALQIRRSTNCMQFTNASRQIWRLWNSEKFRRVVTMDYTVIEHFPLLPLSVEKNRLGFTKRRLSHFCSSKVLSFLPSCFHPYNSGKSNYLHKKQPRGVWNRVRIMQTLT